MSLAESPVAEAGRQYLETADAEAWAGLLRVGFHLRERAVGEAVAGFLGGHPLMPDDLAWPVWEEHGPLTFVGAVDCGAVPVGDLDLPLPKDGALLFFYFDGQVDHGEASVGYWEPGSTAGGARVLYVPADVELNERETPEPITAFPRLLLGGDLVETAPDWEHPAFREAFGDPYDPDTEPSAATGDEFSIALDEIRRGRAPHHQVGGFALPVQGAVEEEAAMTVHPGSDPEVVQAREALAGQLVLLAQFDSDRRTGMGWGESGRLYWLISRDDLAAGRFEAALFTWQST